MATGPKPVYVPPKRPLLARRGFWAAVGVVVLAGAAAGVIAGFMIKRSNDRHDAEGDIVARLGRRIDTSLQPVGQPFGGTFQAFPTLTQAIGQVKNAGTKASDAAKETARAIKKQANLAYGEIQGIPTASTTAEHPAVADIADAQADLADALQIYREVAQSLLLAAGTTGKERDRLVSHAEDLLAIAQGEFARGYAKLSALRSDYGVATAPSLPAPVPSGVVSP